MWPRHAPRKSDLLKTSTKRGEVYLLFTKLVIRVESGMLKAKEKTGYKKHREEDMQQSD